MTSKHANKVSQGMEQNDLFPEYIEEILTLEDDKKFFFIIKLEMSHLFLW